MSATAAEWDARHRAAQGEQVPEAAIIVRELLPLLPGGPALDVACGRGRNTLLLASRGQTVTAVDWSHVALEILEVRARHMGIPVHRKNSNMHPIRATTHGIETVCTDLRNMELGRNEFALVLCTNYLERALFPGLSEALKPGGALLYETYTTDQLAFADGPRNPEYLLKPGELREAFSRLEIVFYRELRAGQGIATLLGRNAVR